MRYFDGLLKIALFVFLLGFAVKNSELVTLRYYFGYQWHVPLVLIILIFLAIGAALGVAACLGYLFRQRRELLKMRQALSAAETALSERKDA
ncbi:MAG: LapA family protein [Sulfuriferula sp.]|nr:LapA family protein [Sulfuriferula sp.]